MGFTEKLKGWLVRGFILNCLFGTVGFNLQTKVKKKKKEDKYVELFRRDFEDFSIWKHIF